MFGFWFACLVYGDILHMLCCVFVVFVLVLCLVCQMSLDFPFLIALLVFSSVHLILYLPYRIYTHFSALIDERGIEPAYNLLDELGGWPVTEREPRWSEENFDLINLMVKLRFYNSKILVDQWVSADDKNSEVNIIQVSTIFATF